jgi:hypothetical protein
MKTTWAWLAAAVAAVALGGCDPFEEQGNLGGTPRLIRAGAFDMRHVSDPAYVDAAGDTGVVALTADVITEAVPDDPATPEDESAPEDLNQTIIELQFSALLDGASVQARSPVDPAGEDCTPVGLTIAPPAPAGQQWFTCYDSTAASADHRGRIWVFRNQVAPTPDNPEPDPGDFFAATLDPNVTYTITGSVRSEGGAQIPVNVTVNTVP